MNRFVKKNFMLVLVLSVALILVAFLLALAAVQHTRMASYIAKTEELRQQIAALHKQKPVPVRENEFPLRKNAELYTEAANKLENYFGQPFKPAMDAFLAKLNEKRLPKFQEPWTCESLRDAFRDGIDGGKGWKDIPADNYAEQRMYCENFRLNNFSNWNEALQVFRTQIEKVTTEPLNSDSTVNEIILAQLGVPRTMEHKLQRLNRFLDDYRLKLLDINNKLGVETEASDFTFPAAKRLFTKEQFPLVSFHMDVIGDIYNRICKTDLRQLENIKKRPLEGVQEGSFMRYDYSIEVIGTMAEVRKFIKNLEDAYSERRLYVVRSVFLYQLKDEAKNYISQEAVDEKNADSTAPQEETAGRRGRRAAVKQTENTQEPTMSETLKKRLEANRLAEIEREKSLQPTQRSSYGRLIIGEEKECRAVIDISYIVKPIQAI